MKDFVPQISVIMPCYNEEKFIAKAIDSLVDHFFQESCELVVINGMSSDKTEEIVQSYIRQGLSISVFENKKKLQVYGLNLGITKAKGEIIIRTDAHCVYPSGYLKKCVDLLKKTGASNVGGVMQPQGSTLVQQAIAQAMRHPVGVGDAKFHLGNFNGFVDSVYLGTFWKKLFDEIGLYDTNCKTNEDGELNIRILKAGKRIYLDSSIKVTYSPRESFKDLAVQYFNYGKGRCYTTLKHKKITSLRQIGPVILVLSISLSVVLSFWNRLFLFFPISYLLALFLTALLSWPKKCIPLKQRILMGIAWGILHVSWGLGFLSYLILRG